MSQYISNPDETKELFPRFRIFYVFIALTFAIFLSRLWYLQIIEGSELREFSEKNRIKQIKIMAPRGLILDREGKILVENHPGFEAILQPQYIKDLPGIAHTLSPILKMEPERIVQRFQRSRRQNGPYVPVKIKDNLSRDEVFRLKRIILDTPGLDIRETVVRHYPLAENGAQLLGYVGEISKRQIQFYNEMYKGVLNFEQGDIIGKSGLEEVLEKEIRGQDGVQFVQVDAFGRETTSIGAEAIYGETMKNLEPAPGYSAVLTIDRHIQEAAYKFFSETGRIGGVVAMKSNGEVLAWVSTPSFNPNDFSTGISSQLWSKLVNDPFKPLRNKVIQDHFSPGSTFKAFVASTALEEKIISPSTIIACPGSLRFGRRDYHDHLKGGHGNITVLEALERSSNVFFYKMGIQLGIEKMHPYISAFGIGQKTGVELQREVAGLMPSAEWKKKNLGEEWQPGENLSAAIGQGFIQSTPLQLAVAYNAIGRGGKVVEPFLVRKVIDTDGKVVRERGERVVRDISEPNPSGMRISKETLAVVKEGLRRVVQGPRGTAKHVNILGADIAGKTGTSQVMGFSADQIYTKCENHPIQQRHHGWFVAFAPAKDPEIVVAALAEHACSGSQGAGPVVKEIMKTYFEKYHPEKLAEAQLAEKKKRAMAPAAPAQTTETNSVVEGE
jgi:penicillin-binding protein 2